MKNKKVRASPLQFLVERGTLTQSVAVHCSPLHPVTVLGSQSQLSSSQSVAVCPSPSLSVQVRRNLSQSKAACHSPNQSVHLTVPSTHFRPYLKGLVASVTSSVSGIPKRLRTSSRFSMRAAFTPEMAPE